MPKMKSICFFGKQQSFVLWCQQSTIILSNTYNIIYIIMMCVLILARVVVLYIPCAFIEKWKNEHAMKKILIEVQEVISSEAIYKIPSCTNESSLMVYLAKVLILASAA